MTKLLTSYERLAKVYAKKAGINLVVRGGGFCTDGKKIVIAEIPDKLNKILKDPALAGLVHECNHIKHSWFPRNKKESDEKGLDQFQKKYKGLINNIEDVRILHLGRDEYPGMDSLQKSGLKFIKETMLIKEIDGKKIPMPTLLGMCIQYKESNFDSSFFPDTINQMAELTKDIWHGTQWTPYEKGHNESEVIVKRIIKRLQQQQKSIKEDKDQETDQEQQEGTGKSKKKDKQEKGENINEDEKNNEKARKESEEKDDKKDNKKNNETKPQKEKGEGDIDSEENGSTSEDEEEDFNEDNEDSDSQPPKENGNNTDYNGKDLNEDINNFFKEDNNAERNSGVEPTGIMEIMVEVVEKIIEDFNKKEGKHIPHPVAVALDEEEHIKNIYKDQKIDSYDLQKNKEKLRTAIEEIDKETQKLKAKALPLLMAEKRDSFIYEQKEGIIDGAQLYKLQKGNGNIYKQKVLGKKINTAVTILCDVSGSMCGGKIRMLKSTLLVIGDTMFALKIPFEILSYTTSKNRPQDLMEVIMEFHRNHNQSIYNRLEPLQLTIIKDFNENYPSIRNLIPQMDSLNNTPTNEAFTWGCKRLIQRKENRKILFILEDGKPGLELSDNRLLERDLKERVDQAEKDGIEVIGIGLLSDSVSKFYNNFIVIAHVSQISIKVYNALLKTLKTHNRR